MATARTAVKKAASKRAASPPTRPNPEQPPGFSATVELIDPDRALEYLASNLSNRRLNKQHVISLAAAMERGEWHLNGQSISFDSEGKLQDGQHRLTAVVKSGITVQMLVVRNVDPSARPTIDVGRKRKVSDELTMRGERNTTTMSALLTMIRRIDGMPGSGANVVLTSVMALEMVDKDPDFREAAAIAEALRGFVSMPSSVTAYCQYHFGKVSKEAAELFWEPFQSGTFSGSDDPRFVLQRTLTRYAKDPRFSSGQFMNKKLQAALTFRAWNAWRKDRTVKSLRWRPDVDDFPKAT